MGTYRSAYFKSPKINNKPCQSTPKSLQDRSRRAGRNQEISRSRFLAFFCVFWSPPLPPSGTIFGQKSEKMTTTKSNEMSRCFFLCFLVDFGCFVGLVFAIFGRFFRDGPKKADMRFVSVFTIRIGVRASPKRPKSEPKSLQNRSPKLTGPEVMKKLLFWPFRDPQNL